MRKFLVLAVLATVIVVMLVQFAPAIVFGAEPTTPIHVRLGIR